MMEHLPNDWHDVLMMFMGAVVPLLVQVVQAFLRALERKADSLWKEKRRNSDRPPAEHVEPVIRELTDSWQGKLVPRRTLNGIVLKKKEEEENGNGKH